MWVRSIVRWFFVAALFASPAASEEEGEWERPYDVLLPATRETVLRPEALGFRRLSMWMGDSDFVAGRVVDADTGQPLPSARLELYEDPGENEAPRRIREVLANPEGRFTIPHRRDSWLSREERWQVRAPGYATALGLDPVIALRRSVAASARLVDWAGRPLGLVALRVGSKHLSMRAIRTEEDGTFLLEDMNPGDWIDVLAPAGSASRSVPVLEALRWGSRRADVVLSPGITVGGTILDVAGRPSPGTTVRADRGVRRSTTTAADGTFTLSGVEPGAMLEALWRDEDGERAFDVGKATSEAALRFRLGEKGVRWEDDGGPGEVSIAVRTAAGAPAAGLGVQLTRDDGRFLLFRTDARGDIRATVPEGRYVARENSPFAPARVEIAPFRVPAGADVRIAGVAHPRPLLVVEGGSADRSDMVVALEGYEKSLEVPFGSPAPEVHLDPDEVAVVRSDGSFFPVGTVVEGVRRVVVPRPAVHRLRLSRDPPIVWAWLRSPVHPELEFDSPRVRDGVAETLVRGPVLLGVDTGDERLEFRVELPAGPSAEIVLDRTTALPPPEGFDARIALRMPTGMVPSQFLVVPGEVGGRWKRDQAIDVDGTSFLVRGPGRFLVQGEDLQAREVVVERPDRYPVSWGPCVLIVHARDQDAVPIDAWIEIDGVPYLADRKSVV